MNSSFVLNGPNTRFSDYLFIYLFNCQLSPRNVKPLVDLVIYLLANSCESINLEQKERKSLGIIIIVDVENIIGVHE